MSGEQTFFQRNYFLLRRLHSLSGVVPIGMFMIMHLTTNSSVVWGAINSRQMQDGAMDRGVATFQHEVSFINNMPLLLLIEIFGLWLPIAFHAIFGIYFAMSGSNNVARYAYQGNKRYALQRLTGYIGFVFVLYHVATLRWGWSWLTPGGTNWSHYFASSTLAAALKGTGGEWTIAGVIVSLGYFIGVTSLVFHFANGLWTAAITWGLTVSEKSQQRWGQVCAGLGAGLMLAGWSALFGFVFLVNPSEALVIEEQMVLEKYGPDKLEEIRKKYLDQPEIREQAIRTAADWPYPGPAPDVKD